MNNDQYRDSLLPAGQTPEQNAFDEARMMYERMSGEIRRQAEIDQKDTRPRSPLVKMLLALMLAAGLAAVAAGIYGIYNFPDAPLRQTNGGYVGKYGKPHAKEEFEKFLLWKKSMLITFPAVFALGFAFVIIDARQRRQGKLIDKQTI